MIEKKLLTLYLLIPYNCSIYKLPHYSLDIEKNLIVSAIGIVSSKIHFLPKDPFAYLMTIMPVFPNLFCLRHPYSVLKIFRGTPGKFNRYKDQGKVTIGGTPGTSSRHPGWEPLLYVFKIKVYCVFKIE